MTPKKKHRNICKISTKNLADKQRSNKSFPPTPYALLAPHCATGAGELGRTVGARNSDVILPESNGKSMELKEIVLALDAMLDKLGVGLLNPDPKLAWQVFKEFAHLPVDSDKVKGGSVGIEFTHYADRDNELWMGFSRDICFIGEDGEDLGLVAVSCDLTHQVPLELVAIDKSFSSWGYDNLQQFFGKVESSPEFQQCMHLTEWNWEPTHWHWDRGDEDE